MTGENRHGIGGRRMHFDIDTPAPIKACPKCGGPINLPLYLVSKTDLCYDCYLTTAELRLANIAERIGVKAVIASDKPQELRDENE